MRLGAQHEVRRAVHYKAVAPVLLDHLGDGALLYLRRQRDDDTAARQNGHKGGGAEKPSTTHSSHIERILSTGVLILDHHSERRRAEDGERRAGRRWAARLDWSAASLRTRAIKTIRSRLHTSGASPRGPSVAGHCSRRGGLRIRAFGPPRLSLLPHLRQFPPLREQHEKEQGVIRRVHDEIGR